MPHPGSAVMKKSFKGDFEALDSNFVLNCQAFFDTTMKNIKSGSLNDKQLFTGEDIFNLFKV
jgi:hypothetical protein